MRALLVLVLFGGACSAPLAAADMAMPLGGGDAQPPEDGGAPPDAASQDGAIGDGAVPEDGATPILDGGEQCTRPDAFPTPCETSATTAPSAGDYGGSGAYDVTVSTVANPRPRAPAPVSIYQPVGVASAPVLFFSHAYGASDVTVYDALLRRLVSHGVAVVFVPYYPNGSTGAVPDANAERYAQLWAGFTAAVAAHSTDFDLTRVGFVGHSFGGGATPEMARRGFVEQGWGANGRFMFIMAPWYSWGSGYDTIPADVRTVIQVYWDDDTNDHHIAKQEIWDKLNPAIEKRWEVVYSDSCSCGLNAGHPTPITAGGNPDKGAGDNDHDVWGSARRIEALASYAFGDATAKAVAYGDDASMGNWLACGGRAVTPMGSSSTPVMAPCATYVYLEANRCNSADPDYACP